MNSYYDRKMKVSRLKITAVHLDENGVWIADDPDSLGYYEDAKVPMRPAGWRKPWNFNGEEGQLLGQVFCDEPDGYTFNQRFGKPAKERRENVAEPALDTKLYEQPLNIFADYNKYSVAELSRGDGIK